ncbi:MAG TPA: peptidylprolyl isomerase [Cytophagaceae bacterium]|jgi:peptidyl-prolyl cis-trans isomerase SurA|nr:peptidylprolyl isomerase [Cytophagaceae bacterium]
MKKISFLVITALLLFSGCKLSKKSQTIEPIIETIGGTPVYVSEFSYVYNKNNASNPDAYTKDNINEYLNLYTNFKLKVREAEAMGLDTSASFKKELEGYRKQLAQPYLTEKSVTDQLTKEAYERMKEEINASHILLTVSPDAEPKDTLAAYNKLMDIRKKAMNGENFEKLAVEYSQDPSAKQNKGNLGYFTAMQMVYPFESAAYNTKKGEVSMPVRTRFGYHLVKVNDRRKSQGQVKVAHIMVRATTGLPQSDSLAAKEKIDEIYSKLKAGEEWNALVAQFSDDASSKNKNGELQWFSAGRMIPSFEEASFALQKPGDISSPIQTPYGWHIIKLLEKKELESFQQMEPNIKSKVSKDRSEINKAALISRLKKENNFIEYPKALDAALAMADSSLLQGSFKKTAEAKNNQPLFEINKKKYNINDFFAYIKDKQKVRRNATPSQYMRVLYSEYVNDQLISYEEAHLGEKYPDYRMLVKEYRDGILLFQLMDEKVWSKAIEDTAGLKSFFNKNRDKYKWDYRAHATIFNLADKASIEKLKSELKKGLYKVNDFKFDHIFFAEGKYDLTDETKKAIDNVLPQLGRDKSQIIEISASADYREATGKNADISKKRAVAVKNYLISKGLDSAAIIIRDMGKAAKRSVDKERAMDRFAFIALYSKSLKTLEKNFNEKAPLTLQATEGVFQKGENEILKQIEWKADSFTVDKDSRAYYIIISKIDDPRQKTFEEARGLAISDYQQYLEEQWLIELKKKYPVVINQVEVQKLERK